MDVLPTQSSNSLGEQRLSFSVYGPYDSIVAQVGASDSFFMQSFDCVHVHVLFVITKYTAKHCMPAERLLAHASATSYANFGKQL